MHDVFISYAHEDRKVAMEIEDKLSKSGLNVWIDELKLKIGDSISEEIGKAIKKSKYGIIILSKHHLIKQWPREELKLLFNLQLSTGQKIILPIWHGISNEEIRESFPFLMDIKALSTEKMAIDAIVQEIHTVVKGIGDVEKKESLQIPINNNIKIFLKRPFEKGKDKQSYLVRTLIKPSNMKSSLRRSIE
ncbi:MAG: TIR domain protein [Candidatus Argoarchaeum ethanivorans]|uniref:ADP-ribosyl cyclase/cyclic ADP-ribose hydrolase n=1 Tax=Candidatus Argoarchaeum ethanivorans TaxID=2608793 RepID=A0A811T5T2_9EURY|nr:MAG: TIR domain protein [Candidatus Argoarchaeum ethanivorans]